MIKLFSITLFILFSLPALLPAAEHARKERFNLTLSEWVSGSDSWWEISDTVSSVSPPHSWKSRLDFNNNDSDITMIDGTFRYDQRVDVKLSYGSGKISKGSVRDRDWITVPSGNDYDRLVSESRESGGGDASIFEAGADILLTSLKKPVKLYLYLGYFYYEDNIKISNGIQTVTDNTYYDSSDPYWEFWGFYPVGTSYPALDSRYDFSWELLKLGLNGELKKSRLTLEAGGYYLHLYSYRGDGLWNLRPLTFTHESNDGYGLEAFLKASYDVAASVRVSLGYRYFLLKANNGLDTKYFADGAAVTTPLDAVESTREGPFVSLEMLF